MISSTSVIYPCRLLLQASTSLVMSQYIYTFSSVYNLNDNLFRKLFHTDFSGNTLYILPYDYNYNDLSHALFYLLNILTQYSKIYIYHYLIIIIVIGLVSNTLHNISIYV